MEKKYIAYKKNASWSKINVDNLDEEVRPIKVNGEDYPIICNYVFAIREKNKGEIYIIPMDINNNKLDVNIFLDDIRNALHDDDIEYTEIIRI